MKGSLLPLPHRKTFVPSFYAKKILHHCHTKTLTQVTTLGRPAPPRLGNSKLLQKRTKRNHFCLAASASKSPKQSRHLIGNTARAQQQKTWAFLILSAMLTEPHSVKSGHHQIRQSLRCCCCRRSSCLWSCCKRSIVCLKRCSSNTSCCVVRADSTCLPACPCCGVVLIGDCAIDSR